MKGIKMKLTWKQVECAKCKSCLITRYGKPGTPNAIACWRCLSRRLNERQEQTRKTICNIYRIANQFTIEEAHHFLKDSGNDYRAWLNELVKIGDDAIAAIKKELNKRNAK